MIFSKPMFLHGFSACLHLILFLALFIYWILKRLKAVNPSPPSIQSSFKEKTRFLLYYKPTLLLSCLGLSLLNLIIFGLSQFIWCTNGWSDERILVQFDLVLRVLAWISIFAYLHVQLSSELKFPVLLRVWWGFSSFMSCYFLVIDLVMYQKDQIFPARFWVLDVISSVMGLFIFCAGVSVKKNAENTLHEPLLNANRFKGGDINGNTSRFNESSKNNSGENATPFSTASFFSLLTFSWMGSLLGVGNRKTLDIEDVPELDISDSVNGVYPIFRNKLEFYCASSEVETFKLVKAIVCSVWRKVAVTALLAMIYTVATYVGPYLIDTFVQCLNGHQEFNHEGYVLVSVFFLAKLVECLAQRHWFFMQQQAGVRVKAALVGAIYSKGLTLSSQSRQCHSSGEIINFMTVDAERIGDFSRCMHDLWMVPIQVGLALIILYKNLGLASVAAFVATVIVMLANVPLGAMQENFQEKLMASKDKRMKATSEILRNMRILKLQGWEMKFLSKIIDLRKSEEGWLKKYVYTSAMTTFLFWGAPTFVSVVTFGACMLMGIPLESGKILSALATFRILQEPIYKLPDTISMVAQAKVSLDRIASFLCLSDLDDNIVEKLPRSASGIALEIENGNFSWDLSLSTPTLRDLNIQVNHGMRVAVCGTVGSGKSSFLSCILGEVPKVSGTVKISGTKAFVAQSPWIQSGKIEDNILFGKEMDREMYGRVLEACSLKKDLEILSFGDQTVIGERGINLSGGQKQRIQIARAIYQDADVYLFDDPFSAVDAHTGSHIFKECLLGLLSSKTVIYVTHQVEFLPSADLILVLKDGKITQAGKYEDILNSGTDFMELVGAHEIAMSALDSFEAGVKITDAGENFQQVVHKKEDKREEQECKADETVVPQGQLVQKEETEKGQVGFWVYWKYITTAYGGALVPLILLVQVTFQALQIGSNYWMAWATPISKDVESPVKGSTLILVYVLLAVGSSLCVLVRTTIVATAGYKNATLLFNKMHLCIFRAAMSFFDSTPSGRILNRVSTDQSTVDTKIATQMGYLASSTIQLLGIIAVMSQVAWQVFIVFIPIIAICIWYQRYYISTARDLARLVGICKAPVIQHFAETISGSTTIRSFSQEPRFMDTNLKLTDACSRPKFYSAVAMEWLCFRLDLLSSVIFALSSIFLISMPQGVIDPGVAGLTVTYGLNLNMLQTWVILNLCNVENRIISVERILQFSSIPSEPPLAIEASRPLHDWPSHGEVDIRDLQVRYAPHMPLVLRGLTCIFQGGKKTGIVGRTGSGKSTLIQTLFRIVDPSAGQILIDGINISTIGLHDLRSRLSIIPQDPTMFEGTVRSNLDPLEEYTDEQIWEALDKCQLGEVVRKKEGKLGASVIENGENWSMGQRQLVCLARVLLKKSKILVLDEATASVDTATDNLIQQTLRQQFWDCTVITIAHRITSVLDSDMVLLLDHGLAVEYDSPTKLLENKKSSFSKLVAEYSSRSSSSFQT
ncbi:hypothetical protein MKW98_030715 [Papaver atlanticum]|uniref:ABC transporter C family member 3 n=1 Tax=Papaver atlanticum TaxID=357466 RepID=A0AAD4RU09_9MAGN|nr:hypothetical protein MKW98_030715 [Papaver atlanticum]